MKQRSTADGSSWGQPAGLTLGKMYDCIARSASGDDTLNFIYAAKKDINSLDNGSRVGWNAAVVGGGVHCIDIFIDSECKRQTVSEFLVFLESLIAECGRSETFAIEWRRGSGLPDFETAHTEGIHYDADMRAFVISGSTRIPGVRSRFFGF